MDITPPIFFGIIAAVCLLAAWVGYVIEEGDPLAWLPGLAAGAVFALMAFTS